MLQNEMIAVKIEGIQLFAGDFVPLAEQVRALPLDGGATGPATPHLRLGNRAAVAILENSLDKEPLRLLQQYAESMSDYHRAYGYSASRAHWLCWLACRVAAGEAPDIDIYGIDMILSCISGDHIKKAVRDAYDLKFANT